MATPAAAPRPSVPAPRRSRLALARARRRSELRRGSDRLRSAVAELEVLALVAAAVLCVLLGMSVYQQGQAHSLAQARQLRPVQAKLVSAPYASGVGGDLAQVSWHASNGVVRQDVVSVPSADRPGDQVRVWLDAKGDVASAPASARDNAATGVLTGFFTLMGAGVVIVLTGAFARSRLDRRDEEAWQAEWQVYEPLWSRRR